MTVDADGRIGIFNDAAARLLGLTPAEAQWKLFAEVFLVREGSVVTATVAPRRLTMTLSFVGRLVPLAAARGEPGKNWLRVRSGEGGTVRRVPVEVGATTLNEAEIVRGLDAARPTWIFCHTCPSIRLEWGVGCHPAAVSGRGFA